MRVLIELDLESKLTKQELEKLQQRAAESGCDTAEIAASLIKSGLRRRRKTKEAA